MLSTAVTGLVLIAGTVFYLWLIREPRGDAPAAPVEVFVKPVARAPICRCDAHTDPVRKWPTIAGVWLCPVADLTGSDLTSLQD